MSHTFTSERAISVTSVAERSYTLGMQHDRNTQERHSDRPTMPPSAADDAAIEYAAALAAEGGGGSAAFFACAERVARKLGLR